MANRTTHSHRRILAAPEPNPSSHSVNPTHKKSAHKPTLTTSNSKTGGHPTNQNPDPSIPSKKPFFMTNHFSGLNLNHKTRTPQQHNHQVSSAGRYIHLQAKAMMVSADADSSRFLLAKSNYGLTHSHKADKGSLKEKFRKASKDLDKKKEQQQQQQHHHQVPVLDSKKIVLMTTPKEKELKINLHERQQTKKLVSANSLGRRRSFCGSQVELADILANCGVKIVAVDMPPFMQVHAVDFARKTHDSLEKFTSKTLALTLKKEFDGVYGPAWHCIVGTSFGSFVTHSVGGFLYFSMDQKLYVLLFKTTVQRTD